MFLAVMERVHQYLGTPPMAVGAVVHILVLQMLAVQVAVAVVTWGEQVLMLVEVALKAVLGQQV
jgi:hypothetical protein